MPQYSECARTAHCTIALHRRVRSSTTVRRRCDCPPHARARARAHECTHTSSARPSMLSTGSAPTSSLGAGRSPAVIGSPIRFLSWQLPAEDDDPEKARLRQRMAKLSGMGGGMMATLSSPDVSASGPRTPVEHYKPLDRVDEASLARIPLPASPLHPVTHSHATHVTVPIHTRSLSPQPASYG